jgi:hypothetical protein
LPLGFYQNFPPNVHYIENYASTLSGKQLQQKIIQSLISVNRKELSFEEVSIPTIPSGVVIFEFGLAEGGNFNFLSEDEAKRALAYVAKQSVQTLDFFVSIRYYKTSGGVRQALKFDYFMLRMIFRKDSFEVQVFHERGPLYLSAQDVVAFIVERVNGQSKRIILKQSSSDS